MQDIDNKTAYCTFYVSHCKTPCRFLRMALGKVYNLAFTQDILSGFREKFYRYISWIVKQTCGCWEIILKYSMMLEISSKGAVSREFVHTSTLLSTSLTWQIQKYTFCNLIWLCHTAMHLTKHLFPSKILSLICHLFSICLSCFFFILFNFRVLVIWKKYKDIIWKKLHQIYWTAKHACTIPQWVCHQITSITTIIILPLEQLELSFHFLPVFFFSLLTAFFSP